MSTALPTPRKNLLQYHSYAFLMSSLDAEWTRNLSHSDYAATPFLSALSEMRNTLESHWIRIEANYAEWIKYQPSAHSQEDFRGGPLYKCQGWIPFGHADCVAWSLIDDLDAAQTVIERYRKTVEEVVVAFCPQMFRFHKDFNLGACEDGVAERVLIEPHSLFEHSVETTANVLSFATQRESPLLLFSRVRMNALLTLGRALPLQEVVYSAMARKIGEAWRILKQNTIEAKECGYEVDDLNNTKICFLDLQEEEEIGIIIQGRNFEVAASFLASIQAITIGDLAKAEAASGDRLQTIFNTRFHLELARKVMPLDSDWNGDKVVQAVFDNHVFRWARSTAAVSWQALAATSIKDANSQYAPDELAEWQRSLGLIGGHIAIDTGLGILPGHQNLIETQILSDIRISKVDIKPALNVRLHALGTDDLALYWTQWEKNPSLPDLIATRAALTNFTLFFDNLREHSNFPKHHQSRHVSGWLSRVSLPVPIVSTIVNGKKVDDWFHPSIGAAHCSIIHEGLKIIGASLNNSPFSVDALRHSTRAYGLPVYIRRSLVFLYENFVNILANPHLFDVVLDFVDVLATLSASLSETLPEKHCSAQFPDTYTPRADLKVVRELGRLLDAIDDAFELRLRRVYPENAIRDWALDFRSTLHQVVLGSEAVLKCALAVLRKDVIGLDDKLGKNVGFASRNCVGVVMQLSYNAGMRVQQLQELSRDDNREGKTRLAVFEADFPHLAHIPGFVEVYHEAFHLIFDEIRTLVEDNVDLIIELGNEAPSSEKKARMTTAEEVFAQCMTAFFIFDGDTDLMIKDHLVAYTTAPSSVGKKAQESFAINFFPVAMAKLMCEIAHQTFTERNHSEPLGAADLCTIEWEIEMLPRIDVLVQHFVDLAFHYSELFPDFKEIFCKDPSGLAFLEEIFGEQFGWFLSNSNLVWNAARTVFCTHARRIVGESFPPEVAGGTSFLFPSFQVAAIKIREDPEFFTNHHRKLYNSLVCRVRDAVRSAWGEPRFADCGYAAIVGIDFVEKAGDCLDANLLIRKTVFEYLKHARSCDILPLPFGRRSNRSCPIASRFEVRRKPKGKTPEDVGVIDFDYSVVETESIMAGGGLSPIMIDRCYVPSFSFSPSVRRQKLGRQIGVLKTVWDIASRNRARRLLTLLSESDKKPLP